jgi:hypothetical protein
MNRFLTFTFLGGILLSVPSFAAISFVATPAGIGANDQVLWSQLNGDADGSVVPGSSTALSSVNGLTTTVKFNAAAGDGGLLAVVCPASPSCSWSSSPSGMVGGDTDLWAFSDSTGAGTGPIQIGLGAALNAVGLWVDADTTTAYTVRITAFNGATNLGNFTASSDKNGDAVFLGVKTDIIATRITTIIISLVTCADCGGTGVDDLGDLAVDRVLENVPVSASSVPEPTSMALLGAGLLGLGWKFRSRLLKNRALLSTLVLVTVAGAASAQMHPHYVSFRPKAAPASLGPAPATPATEIPMWTYNVTAGADLGGASWSGQIIGRDPNLKGKTTTTIPLQIVPVIIIINNGAGDTHTYDPTVNDGCEPAGHTAVDLVQNSPIFTNTSWTFNGTNVGTTQYHDAHLRASFWSLVGGTPYHLVENVTVLPTQTLTFGSVKASSGIGQNISGGGLCGFVGVLNVDQLETAVNTLLASLSPTVNIGTLPMVLVDSVVSSEVGDNTSSGCCVLGFHSGFAVGSKLQVTSIFDFDYSNAFGNQDVTVISHELGEAIFDPTGVNPTPVWGGIGQDFGNCPSGGGQNNLEVGDPLSPGFTEVANEHVTVPGTDSNEWVVAGTGPSAGVTYHLQELVLFSWFYGGTNLGLPGFFSNNGTFHGDMVLCSAGGGTN